MLKLSKKTEYGLIALLHMDSVPTGDLASAKDISEQYRIPHDLLGKVLQALSKSDMVDSVHGAKGGYRLRRPLEELSLGQVIESIEGPVHLAQCQDNPEACEQFCACTIREPVVRIQQQLTKFIHGVRLAAFRHAEQAEWVGVEIT